MKSLVTKHARHTLPRASRVPLLYGRDLRDAREELFVRMVCDGMALSVAFVRAGFASKSHDAPSNLFELPRVQERAAAILEARRTQGAVTLPEVTDMLKRVFAGAYHEGEYNAAHNAAFSLARLYGHVTDKASVEIIRKPSRDPDAPTEQALGAWVQGLGPAPLGLAGPVAEGSGPVAEGSGLEAGPVEEGSFVRRPDAPAEPLGDNTNLFSNIKELNIPSPDWLAGLEGSSPEKLSDINGLEPPGGRPENGAPDQAVTGSPSRRAQSEPLGPDAPKPPRPAIPGHTRYGLPRRPAVKAPGGVRPTPKKRGPLQTKRVPGRKIKKRKLTPRLPEIPSAKDLFG